MYNTSLPNIVICLSCAASSVLARERGKERWLGSNWAPGFSSEYVQRANEELQRERD